MQKLNGILALPNMPPKKLIKALNRMGDEDIGLPLSLPRTLGMIIHQIESSIPLSGNRYWKAGDPSSLRLLRLLHLRIITVDNQFSCCRGHHGCSGLLVPRSEIVKAPVKDRLHWWIVDSPKSGAYN
jgi:hypothetical protein